VDAGSLRMLARQICEAATGPYESFMRVRDDPARIYMTF
jgi:hypothetical protein